MKATSPITRAIVAEYQESKRKETKFSFTCENYAQTKATPVQALFNYIQLNQEQDREFLKGIRIRYEHASDFMRMLQNEINLRAMAC